MNVPAANILWGVNSHLGSTQKAKKQMEKPLLFFALLSLIGLGLAYLYWCHWRKVQSRSEGESTRCPGLTSFFDHLIAQMSMQNASGKQNLLSLCSITDGSGPARMMIKA